MHELSCPACNTPSQYDFSDYIIMCPFCSSSFHFDVETGQKEVFSDHFIIPNTLDIRSVKDLVFEWLKRMHHRPGMAEKEFYITDIKGFSCPMWVVSAEAHTVWKGLVRRKFRNRLDTNAGADYLVENGQFRRSYRWAVSARENICEIWGMTRLHQPKEAIEVSWDGFPLDSTMSRGILEDPGERVMSSYDVREFFDFKFANGMPVLGVEVDEQQGLRRARHHMELYHHELCKLNVDYLVDYRTELEIAGVQLIHIPLWQAKYVYKPVNALRYFYRPKEKRVLANGHAKGVLVAELALVHRDKIIINALICTIAGIALKILGIMWHPAFLFAAVFVFAVAAISIYLAFSNRQDDRGKAALHYGSTLDAQENPTLAT